MKKIAAYFSYALIPMSAGLFAIGYLLDNFNVILSGVLFMFAGNLIYSLQDLKKRIIFFIFHITIFTFLISRPMISMIRGDVWAKFSEDAVLYALNVLFLTLVCLRIGAACCSELIKSKTGSLKSVTSEIAKDKEGFLYTLQTVSLIFFGITMFFYMTVQAEKLIYMQGRDYEEFYVTFSSKLPYAIHIISTMMKYALCIFLATMPSKKKAFIPLVLYLISSIPSLIIGIRNPIVLNAIFVLLYYCLRDIMGDKTRWIGKFERMALIVILPVALIFLSAYNYLRQGESVDMNVFESIVDLFYKQGVSFETLCRGYEALPSLPDVIEKNYTFGGIIDEFTHGSIAQNFFGAFDLGSSNSELMAIFGNSFAHSMSYVAHPRYLQGEGWGSSYLLETFADWRYIGVLVFSLMLGSVMILMIHFFRRSSVSRTVILICLTNLFFAPRAEATGWISFLFTYQFWLAFIFCYLLAWILSDRSSISSIEYTLKSSKRGKYYA